MGYLRVGRGIRIRKAGEKGDRRNESKGRANVKGKVLILRSTEHNREPGLESIS